MTILPPSYFLQDAGVPAGSPEGLQFAKAYWDMILEFTNGDATMLPKLMQIGESNESFPG